MGSVHKVMTVVKQRKVSSYIYAAGSAEVLMLDYSRDRIPMLTRKVDKRLQLLQCLNSTKTKYLLCTHHQQCKEPYYYLSNSLHDANFVAKTAAAGRNL